jgi:hypothetical protein
MYNCPTSLSLYTCFYLLRSLLCVVKVGALRAADRARAADEQRQREREKKRAMMEARKEASRKELEAQREAMVGASRPVNLFYFGSTLTLLLAVMWFVHLFSFKPRTVA